MMSVMQCCASGRAGSEEDEGDHQGASLFDGLLWGNGNSTSSSNVKERERPEGGSQGVVNRHLSHLAGKEHLLVYNLPGKSKIRDELPKAQHVPCNTLDGVPIENEHFVGKVILMYRPIEGLEPSHPYYQHFKTRKRNWEFRLQGRFKTIPTGDIYVGAVLRDFDYDQATAATSVLAMNTAMSLIKYQYRMHFSWGARCKAALEPNAELACCVSDLTVFDQLVVTPAGRPVPLLNSDMDDLSDSHGLSLLRRDLGLAEYGRMMTEVMQGINTQDTYTFRLWGLSQMLDVLNWQLKIGARIGLAHFMKEFPIHVCMYDLGNDSSRNSHGAEKGPQLETHKRYFFDMMGWSNVVKCPSLPSRYDFEDGPDWLEEAEHTRLQHMSSNNSFHSAGSFGSVESQSNSAWTRLREKAKEQCRR